MGSRAIPTPVRNLPLCGGPFLSISPLPFIVFRGTVGECDRSPQQTSAGNRARGGTYVERETGSDERKTAHTGAAAECARWSASGRVLQGCVRRRRNLCPR